MSEVTPDTTTTEAARFVGVAVSTYDHDTFTPLPQTVSGVQRVSEILSAYAYQVNVLSEPGESEARAELRRLLAMNCLPTGGSLIVLWSGHGEPAAEGVLHLIGRDSEPGSAPEVDSGFIAGLATRTGASQVLLLFDTCYAGTGVMSAATVARRVLQELPPNAERIWVGVVASALELQPARDGVFLERLTALLKNGPTDPELRLRWSAHSRGVRGDDVIDALVKEWDVSTQQLDAQMSGNAWVMLPNPRYDPHAPEQVVEHCCSQRGVATLATRPPTSAGVSLRWPALSTGCRRPGLASLWSRGQRGAASRRWSAGWSACPIRPNAPGSSPRDPSSMPTRASGPCMPTCMCGAVRSNASSRRSTTS